MIVGRLNFSDLGCYVFGRARGQSLGRRELQDLVEVRGIAAAVPKAREAAQANVLGMREGNDGQADRRHRKHAVVRQRSRGISMQNAEAAARIEVRRLCVREVSGHRNIAAGRMARLLHTGHEPRLREQRELPRRGPFKRENHYRLQADTETPLDSSDQAPALRQLGGGIGDCAMIDVPPQAMPYETGPKFLHRVEVAAAGTGVGGSPGEIRMRSGIETIYMVKKGKHGRGVEVIEINRAVVDHQVERRQLLRLSCGRAIGRDERAHVLLTHLATGQAGHDWSFGAILNLRMQIANHAAGTVSEGENHDALDAVNVSRHQQFFRGRIETLQPGHIVDAAYYFLAREHSWKHPARRKAITDRAALRRDRQFNRRERPEVDRGAAPGNAADV